MFLSTRLSAVRSAVFTLPDCHNPTMTSTAPLSLDPPSKVVPSISPLTQWQQPVGFFVFPSCDCDWWSFQFVNGIGECLQRLKQYHPSPHISGAQLPRLASPDRRSCCGFSQRTHSSKSSFTSHTVFNFWGIQPPTTSLFLQLNLLTVSSCLLPSPSPYSLSFILLCCFFYLCSLIFLSLGPRFLLHLFIYLSMELSISTCSGSKGTCWWYLSAVRKAGYCSKWGRTWPLT